MNASALAAIASAARSSLAAIPVRQAQGRGRHPRARRQEPLWADDQPGRGGTADHVDPTKEGASDRVGIRVRQAHRLDGPDRRGFGDRPDLREHLAAPRPSAPVPIPRVVGECRAHRVDEQFADHKGRRLGVALRQAARCRHRLPLIDRHRAMGPALRQAMPLIPPDPNPSVGRQRTVLQ
jgi:hypothetical protein